MLAPAARSKLRILPKVVQAAALEGIEEFSHVCVFPSTIYRSPTRPCPLTLPASYHLSSCDGMSIFLYLADLSTSWLLWDFHENTNSSSAVPGASTSASRRRFTRQVC